MTTIVHQTPETTRRVIEHLRAHSPDFAAKIEAQLASGVTRWRAPDGTLYELAADRDHDPREQKAAATAPTSAANPPLTAAPTSDDSGELTVEDIAMRAALGIEDEPDEDDSIESIAMRAANAAGRTAR